MKKAFLILAVTLGGCTTMHASSPCAGTDRCAETKRMMMQDVLYGPVRHYGL